MQQHGILRTPLKIIMATYLLGLYLGFSFFLNEQLVMWLCFVLFCFFPVMQNNVLYFPPSFDLNLQNH